MNHNQYKNLIVSQPKIFNSIYFSSFSNDDKFNRRMFPTRICQIYDPKHKSSSNIWIIRYLSTNTSFHYSLKYILHRDNYASWMKTFSTTKLQIYSSTNQNQTLITILKTKTYLRFNLTVVNYTYEKIIIKFR